MDGSPSRGKLIALLLACLHPVGRDSASRNDGRGQRKTVISEPRLPSTGETIPIRLFLGGFDLTPTFRDVNMKFSTRYYLSLVLIDEGALMCNASMNCLLSPLDLMQPSAHVLAPESPLFEQFHRQIIPIAVGNRPRFRTSRCRAVLGSGDCRHPIGLSPASHPHAKPPSCGWIHCPQFPTLH